jgi:hypothetical protein
MAGTQHYVHNLWVVQFINEGPKEVVLDDKVERQSYILLQ